MDVFVGDVLPPVPMLLPDKHHFLNGHILRLWKEVVNENGHDHDPATKEKEEAELEVTKHA